MTAPVEANAAGEPPAREQLLELLTGVNALAVRLKWGTRSIQTGELPAAARAVLHILKRQGRVTVPALARARGTSRQNIQIIINRLERQGWIGVARNPLHKRSDLVFITESGAAMLERSTARETEILDALLAKTSEAELVAMSQFVQRLRDVLEGVSETSKAPKHKTRLRPPELPKAEAEAADHELPVSLL